MGRIVGIDLGTTNSLVAYVDRANRRSRSVSSAHTAARFVLRSSAWIADGSVIVGEAARRRLLTQPERSIYSVKRLMGRGAADMQDELALFPFRIDPQSKNVIRVMLGDKMFTPPEISAFILRELQELGRSALRRNRRSRGHYRARLFQRRAAPGHQRRRTHRRP